MEEKNDGDAVDWKGDQMEAQEEEKHGNKQLKQFEKDSGENRKQRNNGDEGNNSRRGRCRQAIIISETTTSGMNSKENNCERNFGFNKLLKLVQQQSYATIRQTTSSCIVCCTTSHVTFSE